MKTLAEKALEACKEYDRLLKAIHQNRIDIGDGSSSCDRIVETGDLDGYGNVQYIPDGKDTHLGEVFKGYISSESYEPEHCHYSESKALEIIGDCEGCLKAYKAVQERKSNKKKLGAIKRMIRSIARQA